MEREPILRPDLNNTMAMLMQEQLRIQEIKSDLKRIIGWSDSFPNSTSSDSGTKAANEQNHEDMIVDRSEFVIQILIF
jgi:hypothetical protein